MKRCCKCGKLKDISEFYKNGKYIRSRCKECYTPRVRTFNPEVDRIWRENNKEKLRAYSREFNRKKRERIKQEKIEAGTYRKRKREVPVTPKKPVKEFKISPTARVHIEALKRLRTEDTGGE